MTLKVDSKTAAFSLMVDGSTWLNSADIFMTSKSVQYSVKRGDLLLSQNVVESGMDALGKFTVNSFFFTAIGHPLPLPHNVTFKIMFKQYEHIPAVWFGQVCTCFILNLCVFVCRVALLVSYICACHVHVVRIKHCVYCTVFVAMLSWQVFRLHQF